MIMLWRGKKYTFETSEGDVFGEICDGRVQFGIRAADDHRLRIIWSIITWVAVISLPSFIFHVIGTAGKAAPPDGADDDHHFHRENEYCIRTLPRGGMYWEI